MSNSINTSARRPRKRNLSFSEFRVLDIVATRAFENANTILTSHKSKLVVMLSNSLEKKIIKYKWKNPIACVGHLGFLPPPHAQLHVDVHVKSNCTRFGRRGKNTNSYTTQTYGEFMMYYKKYLYEFLRLKYLITEWQVRLKCFCDMYLRG